jgi:hypothetical protein
VISFFDFYSFYFFRQSRLRNILRMPLLASQIQKKGKRRDATAVYKALRLYYFGSLLRWLADTHARLKPLGSACAQRQRRYATSYRLAPRTETRRRTRVPARGCRLQSKAQGHSATKTPLLQTLHGMLQKRYSHFVIWWRVATEILVQSAKIFCKGWHFFWRKRKQPGAPSIGSFSIPIRLMFHGD